MPDFHELTRPEMLAKMTDDELLGYAYDMAPGSDSHHDAIMEICNRGLTDPEAGDTACNYLPELKAQLVRLGPPEPTLPTSTVAAVLKGLLRPVPGPIPGDDAENSLLELAREQRIEYNARITAAAAKLGITL